MKEKNSWRKWCIIGACLLAAFIICFFLFTDKKTKQVSVGGIIREYKDISVSHTETAVEWPREYQTMYEKFSVITYNEKEYVIKTVGLPVNESLIDEKIGTGTGVGYDYYTEQEYEQDFDIWQINGISPELMIAAQLDGQFYVYNYDEYVPPLTLGEVLDNYNLSQNLILQRFGVYADNNEEEYYTFSDDDYIWEVLEGCRDANFVNDEANNLLFPERISFTATSESLGVYKRVFYVSEDGYIQTNIFDYAYTFFIGETAAKNIISYAMEHAVPAESEPYMYSLSGTITEISEDYILIDDSVLCANKKDGMVFKVLTSDLRISRYVDNQEISVGDIAVINFFNPVNVEEGNVIAGAVSLNKGQIDYNYGESSVDNP